MKHDDRRAGVARAYIDQMQRGACNLDHSASGRVSAFDEPNPDLRDQDQSCERRRGEDCDHGDGTAVSPARVYGHGCHPGSRRAACKNASTGSHGAVG